MDGIEVFDRLPHIMPRLGTYTICSVLVLISIMFLDIYAIPDLPPMTTRLLFLLRVFTSDKICVIAMINMLGILLAWMSRGLKQIIFGELRVIEYQHMYDRLINYVIYKIMFIGAILNPDWKEFMFWTTWFAVLGFLRVISMLGKDRFEYLSFSPRIPMQTHLRILGLLAVIQLVNLGWLVMCLTVFGEAGVSIVMLLSFECYTLFLDTLQTIIKYCMHLYDLQLSDTWENHATYLYYTEFITDTLVLSGTLVHYCHVMMLHGMAFTLINAIIMLNIHAVIHSLRTKLLGFIKYRVAIKKIESRFRDVTPSELHAYNDTCAICRSIMSSAKALPCGHMYHVSCIQSWLECHNSCPTCRRPLNEKIGPLATPKEGPLSVIGYRLWQWLVYIMGGSLALSPPPPVATVWVDRVMEMFPEANRNDVIADFAVTQSIDQTVDNILHNRLNGPPLLSPEIPSTPPTHFLAPLLVGRHRMGDQTVGMRMASIMPPPRDVALPAPLTPSPNTQQRNSNTSMGELDLNRFITQSHPHPATPFNEIRDKLIAYHRTLYLNRKNSSQVAAPHKIPNFQCNISGNSALPLVHLASAPASRRPSRVALHSPLSSPTNSHRTTLRTSHSTTLTHSAQ